MISNFTKFTAYGIHDKTKRKYILFEPLIWDIGAKGSGWQLVLNEGDTFNVSVPRYLEWLVSPHDHRLLPPSAVHDHLLNQGHDNAFSSAEFRRAVIAKGYPRLGAWILFVATLIYTEIKKSNKKG